MVNCVILGLAYILAYVSLITVTCNCVFTFLQSSDGFPVMILGEMDPWSRFVDPGEDIIASRQHLEDVVGWPLTPLWTTRWNNST